MLHALERLFGDRGVDLAALRAEDCLADALDWDSMDVVDLGMELRRHHGVEIPEDIDQIDTIAKLRAFFP